MIPRFPIAAFAAVLGTLMVLPGLAMAEHAVVTNGSGEAAATVEASSENTVWNLQFGELKCATVTTHYEVTHNFFTTTLHGTSIAKGTPKVVPHVGACKMSGLQVLVDLFTSTISLEGGSGAGSLDLTFTIEHPLFGKIMCHSTISSSISYGTKSDKLTFNGSMTGTENIPPCPAAGTFSGDYTVTDEFGEPVVID